MSSAYDQFTAVTGGHDPAVLIRASDLAEIIDTSLLPSEVKQQVIDFVVSQLRKAVVIVDQIDEHTLKARTAKPEIEIVPIE